MPLISSADGKIYYQVKGDGPDLVLLHGLSRSSQYWQGFDRLMSKHFRTITIDFRGLGKSKANVPWSISLSDFAQDVLKVLDQLRINSTHILGLSLGGMVSMLLGVKFPTRVDSLIIVNSSAAGTGVSRVYPMVMPTIFISTLLRRHDQIMKICVGNSFSAEQKAKALKQWQKIQEQEGIPYLTTIKQLLAAMRFNIKDGLTELSRPTTIVHGSHDRFVSYKNSQMLANILPNAKLVCIPGAGHEISLDHPLKLRDVIIDHCAALKMQD